jgi:hypothetical protein
MKAKALALTAALFAAACHPAAAPDAAGADSTASTASSTAPASFSVDALTDNEWIIQGCSSSFSRVGAPVNQGVLFAEDAVDTGAKGFIKINGALINVTLTNTTGGESSPEVRTFEDSAHTVTVVESTTLGEAHEEADSVERSGTLTVTFGDATQTIPVDGGTAC